MSIEPTPTTSSSSPRKRSRGWNCKWCSVVNCPNSRADRPDLSFLRYPKDKDLCKKWLEFSRRSDLQDISPEHLHRNYLLCSEHFEDNCFSSNAHSRTRLLKGAVPTIFSPQASSLSLNSYCPSVVQHTVFELPTSMSSQEESKDIKFATHLNSAAFRKRKQKWESLTSMKVETKDEHLESTSSSSSSFASGESGNAPSLSTPIDASNSACPVSGSGIETPKQFTSNGSGRKKRMDLSLERKMDIIRDYEQGFQCKAEVARKFNIAATTLQTILKNKEKIVQMINHSEFEPDRKRIRRSGYDQVNFAVYQWLKNQRALNLPVNDEMLKSRAEDFAMEIGLADFVAGNSWLLSFKIKYNVSQNYPDEVGLIDTWRMAELPKILDDYNPQDIFNADETCIFWKSLPDASLASTTDRFEEKTNEKFRITALAAANMDGSEKLPLLIIGKSGDPACFRGRRWLPAQYKSNKNGLMTKEIFKEWVRALDTRMGQQMRKICLILDHNHSKLGLENLRNIEVQFLPPEATSSTWPCHQGIIHALKRIYRRKLLIQFIAHYKLNQNDQMPMDLFAAMTLLAESWTEVTQATVANCFLHAGFKFRLGDEPMASDEGSPAIDYENIFGEVVAMLQLPSEATAENYLTIDAYADTGNLLLQNGAEGEEEEDEEEDDSDANQKETPVPTVSDAFAILGQLSSFLSAHGPEDIALDSISILRKYVEAKASKSVQSDVGMLFN